MITVSDSKDYVVEVEVLTDPIRYMNEQCNRVVCMRPKKEINRLKKSMKDLIMK